MPTAPSMMTPRWTDVRAFVPRAAFLLMIAALLATSMSAQAAPAKTSDERRSLLDEGKRQRYAGDEAQALRSFQRAHALSPTP
ncbi:MAG TPA: hypothetical protein VGG33_08740, partial [Polyangia bacterium]